jgi:DNA transformation protein
MAVDESFRDFVFDQLAGLGTLETKNMFGGVALFHKGKAFAKIKHGAVWLKVDDSNREAFSKLGMAQYTYGKDGSRKLNFYETPADVLENADEFVAWARRSMKAALKSAK